MLVLVVYVITLLIGCGLVIAVLGVCWVVWWLGYVTSDFVVLGTSLGVVADAVAFWICWVFVLLGG